MYEIFEMFLAEVAEGIDDFPDAGYMHFIACRQGHHRSQAFAEVAAKLIRRVWPNLEVVIYHLDNLDRPGFALPQTVSMWSIPFKNALLRPPYFPLLQHRVVRV